MDAIDSLNHINDILNSKLTNEEKLDTIEQEINNYFNQFEHEMED